MKCKNELVKADLEFKPKIIIFQKVHKGLYSPKYRTIKIKAKYTIKEFESYCKNFN